MSQNAAPLADPLNRINIDGTEYPLADLPEEARRLIAHIRLADEEITRHRNIAAMLHAARQAWGVQLTRLLSKK